MISKLFKKCPIKKAEKQLANIDNIIGTIDAGIAAAEEAIEAKNNEIMKMEVEADALLDRHAKLMKRSLNLDKLLG